MDGSIPGGTERDTAGARDVTTCLVVRPTVGDSGVLVTHTHTHTHMHSDSDVV